MSVCTRMCVGGMGECVCVCACMFAGVWAHCFPAWPFGSQAAPLGAGHCPHHQPLSLQLHIRGMAAAEAKGLLEEAGSQTLWRKNHGESQSWLSNCPGFTRGSEHDPDVRCGVCAEWWVPLLKESTCSFHLFACVFLTKRSPESGNNRHPTMIKISTPKKAHVSMLHSSLWRDGTHLLWDQGLGSLSWFFHDQVLNESGLLIGKPGELAANDCKKMSKDTLEGSGPVCHKWQQSYQFLLDFLRTHSSISKENSLRHVSLARFLSMYCATFEELNTKYSKQLLTILNS